MLHFIRAIDVSPERSWDLLRWCHERGATEFTWREMGLVGHDDPVIRQANTALSEFRLADATRPTAVVYSGEQERRPVKLWRLDISSIKAIQALLRAGLFTEPTYSEDGWIEDPTFYRSGEIVLGVISHEDEGFLHISQPEADDLLRRGFSLHPKAIYG